MLHPGRHLGIDGAQLVDSVDSYCVGCVGAAGEGVLLVSALALSSSTLHLQTISPVFSRGAAGTPG